MGNLVFGDVTLMVPFIIASVMFIILLMMSIGYGNKFQLPTLVTMGMIALSGYACYKGNEWMRYQVCSSDGPLGVMCRNNRMKRAAVASGVHAAASIANVGAAKASQLMAPPKYVPPPASEVHTAPLALAPPPAIQV